MNRTAIPITDITELNRQRTDYGDIDSLAASIERYGLIQPIVINQEKRLIAGGRRLAACRQLGLSVVDVVFRETLTEDELHELELEENLRRKEMTWQEQCINIRTIHLLKKKRAALDGEKWGQRQTAEMLGMGSHADVNYAVRVAEELLANPNGEISKCDSLTAAWRVFMRREEDRILAELAKRSMAPLNAPALTVSSSQASAEDDIDMLMAGDESGEPISQRSAKDAMPPGRQVGFEPELPPAELSVPCWLCERDGKDSKCRVCQGTQVNWAPSSGRGAQITMRPQYVPFDVASVAISQRLFNGNSIAFMNDPVNKERFDHIITDIPYGIDVEHLNQDSGAMVDIATVAEEHDVEYNIQLIKDFFSAAYACTKPNSFTVTWCDLTGDPIKMHKLTGCYTLWEFMVRTATDAGFKVQRWPFHWVKTSRCQNQCAQYNFTKAVEHAIVCRKGLATMAEKGPNNYVIAHRMDDITDKVAHPFAKPYAVWAPIINAVSLQGQEILEPFAGRGSGVLSLLKANRAVTAVELQTEHYNDLIENVKQFYLSLNPNTTFS